MSAQLGDKITETFNGQNPTSTTVSGSRAIGGTTLTCTSLAGWPIATAVHFATYRKDGTGAKVAGSQTDWKGIVSGSSINTLTRQGGAADGGNGVGDIVEMMPTYAWANDLAKGLENTVNADGTIRSGLTITTPTLTSPTLTNPTSTNPTLNSPTFGGTPATGTLSYIALTNPYKFSVYRNAAQNTGNGAYAIVGQDTKSFDTGSNVDVVTNKGRFTAPVAGFYWFSAEIDGTSAADNGTVIVSLFKNGSVAKEGNVTRAGGTTTIISSVVSGILQLAANDYVEAQAFGTASYTLNVGVTYQNYFDGFLVSAS